MRKLLLWGIVLASFVSVRGWAQPGTVTTILGNVYGYSYGPDVENIADSVAHFSSIKSFCKDSAGNYYIADGDSHSTNHLSFRIRKIEAATHLVHTIAGTGTPGYSGDGGPAVIAQISADLDFIDVDHSGNVVFVDGSRIRKVNTTNGMITTIANEPHPINGMYADFSNNVYYSSDYQIKRINALSGATEWIVNLHSGSNFAGDGGLAYNAQVNNPGAICGDRSGNIYILDRGNNRIRKIDASGIITTIAGNGTPYYNGDGGPALNAGIPFTTNGNYNNRLRIDTSGNLYFVCGGIRKVDAATGLINKVAGALLSEPSMGFSPSEAFLPFYTSDYLPENPGSILFSQQSSIARLSRTYTGINTMSVTDTITTPACAMPVIKAGLRGTVNGTPAPGDSVHIKIVYCDSARYMTIPYTMSVNSITGDTTYGFGMAGNWMPPFQYNFPGNYQPVVYISAIDGYQDQAYLPPLHASAVCDSIGGIFITNIIDSVTTLPCVFPANVRRTIRGTVDHTSTSLLSSQDSVYIKIDNDDSTGNIFVVPVSATDYVLTPGSVSGVPDTQFYFTCTYNHLYTPLPADRVNQRNGYYGPVYDCLVTAIPNNGSYSVTEDKAGSFGTYTGGIYDPNWTYTQIQICDTGYAQINVAIGDTTSACHNTIPFHCGAHVTGTMTGYAASLATLPIRISFGDGTDTAITAHPTTTGNGVFAFDIPTFYHTYSIDGHYPIIVSLDTPVTNVQITAPDTLNLSMNSRCSFASGYFFIDDNHNCIPDAGEIRLSYWPFQLINNTTHDTINAWTLEGGGYYLSLADNNSYTLVSTHSSYYNDEGIRDSLTPSCPAGGTYTIAAGTGSSVSQNFGFNCAGNSGNIDMSVSGFAWGIVPGDTGVLSIWSSNDWGYMCDSVSSTVTLSMDSTLSYAGMWNGPAPTTISGNTLTWNFSTHAKLFDFTANVKVRTSTAAVMGAIVENKVSVLPTAFPDPYLANNSYSWQEPVRSSWDPNEKEVSPKGFGSEGYIENGTPLSYMVHFQNTGNARARNITVIDTLSANLDMATLQIISSSAPVKVYHEPGNVVMFQFSNINLPDSTTDPNGSVGYISFNILPKDSLAGGSTIVNVAGIYFDYNRPVYTNATLNTIENDIADISGASDVCTGAQITLFNSLAGGVWHSAGGNATVVNGVVTGVHEGTDTISYTMYGDKTVTKVVNIVNAPVAGSISGTDSICEGASVVFTASTGGGAWGTSNGGVAAISGGGTMTAVSAGVVTISYSVTNGCGTTTASHTVRVLPAGDCNTDVVAAVAQSVIAIYPNPTNGSFMVELPAATGNATITITDVSGKVINIIRPTTNQQLVPVSLGGLASGTYLIKVEADGKTYRDKVVLW